MAGLADSLAQAPNPFASMTVGDLAADGEAGGDVESIHQEVRATLREVAGRTLGGRGHLLVLTGGAGAGRSHLLRWLRQAERGALLCVPVPLPLSSDDPARQALHHIVEQMQAPVAAQAGAPSEATPVPGAPDNYLGRLVWEVLYAQVCDLLDAARSGQAQAVPAALVRQLAQIVERADEAQRPALGFAVAVAAHWQRLEPEIRKYMLTLPQEGPADAAVRAVLCQYPYEDRRALCVSFLGGEVPGEGDLRRLGVALPPGGVQALGGEAVARRLLGWVCRAAPTPMLLLYDQRGDGPPAGDPKGLRALADVLGEIHEHGGPTGQVLACSQALWTTLYPLVSGRLRGKPQVVPLQALPPDHVRELVLRRLRLLENGSRLPPRPQPFYPFTEDEVLAESWSAGQQTVRETLQHFSARYVERLAKLREPPPPAPRPVVQVPVVQVPAVMTPPVVAPAVVAPPVVAPAVVAPPVVAPLGPPPTAAGVVEAAYQRAILEARGAVGAGQSAARAATLRTAIKELCDALRGIPGGLSGVQVMGCEPILGGGLRLVLQQLGEQQRSVRCALEICNTEMGPGVYGATARLARQVSDGRAEVALLLREERLSAVRGPAGAAADAALAAQLGPSGGVLWLSDEATAELVAAERVLGLCGSGELQAGGRAVSRAQGLGLLVRRQGGPPQGLRLLVGRVSPAAGEALSPEQAPGLPQVAAEAAGAEQLPRQRQTMTGMHAVIAGPGRPVAVPAPRRTLSRMTAISMTAPTEGTAAEILEIIGERAMVEEGLLAKELGLSEDMLPRLIAPLVEQGAIRVTTSVQGRRILIKVPR